MKYNLSNIMTTANANAKTMSRSLALRKAWAEAKIAHLEKAMYAPENSAPACWMPIREELFAKRNALAAINNEIKAANPAEDLKAQLFVLHMKDRWNNEDRAEVARLEKLLAA